MTIPHFYPSRHLLMIKNHWICKKSSTQKIHNLFFCVPIIAMFPFILTLFHHIHAFPIIKASLCVMYIFVRHWILNIILGSVTYPVNFWDFQFMPLSVSYSFIHSKTDMTCPVVNIYYWSAIRYCYSEIVCDCINYTA